MIWNIIDERGNRYRWAKVHAIIEAAWHDNSVSGADEVPPANLETEVTFDERYGISVREAIIWANSQNCPVTLYLRDDQAVPQSSDREVDAAARILDAFGRHNGWWPSDAPSYDDLDQIRKMDLAFIVKGMFRAAAKVRSNAPA